jgi:hypothetical protein
MEITAELFKAMQERKAFTDKAHQSIDRLTRLVEDRATLSADGEGATQTVLPLDRVRPDRQVRLRDPSTVS